MPNHHSTVSNSPLAETVEKAPNTVILSAAKDLLLKLLNNYDCARPPSTSGASGRGGRGRPPRTWGAVRLFQHSLTKGVTVSHSPLCYSPLAKGLKGLYSPQFRSPLAENALKLLWHYRYSPLAKGVRGLYSSFELGMPSP